MPLVLTQNEATEWGHDYDDVLGVSYEYPTIYRRLVEPKADFVYYRGRRKQGGGTQPQVYLGVGRIGPVAPSSEAGRLICRIEAYEAFPIPVPFKIDGRYLETDAQPFGSQAGLYFRRGVREVDPGVFKRIRELGLEGPQGLPKKD
jgi:hypothetical protein